MLRWAFGALARLTHAAPSETGIHTVSTPDVLLSIDLDAFAAGLRQQTTDGMRHEINTTVDGHGLATATWASVEVLGVSFNGALAPRPLLPGQAPGRITVRVTGTVAVAAGLKADAKWTWQSPGANPEPIDLILTFDLNWAGTQPTNQLVGAPIPDQAPTANPKHLPIPRESNTARLFWTDHPAAAFEAKLGALAPGGVRPKRMPFHVWVEEFTAQSTGVVVWVSPVPPAGGHDVEVMVTELVQERLDAILALPVTLAERYGAVGISVFGLVLDGPIAHVIGIRWPERYGEDQYTPWPWVPLQRAISDPATRLPVNLPAALKQSMSPELLKRMIRFAFEHHSIFEDAAGDVSVFDMLMPLPAVGTPGDPAYVGPRAALGGGFAEWLRRQLVHEGRARKEDLDGQLVVDFLSGMDEVAGEPAPDHYAQSYLDEVRADIWPLTGEADTPVIKIDIEANEPSIRFVDPDDYPVLFAGMVPEEHAVIRARMTYDSAPTDGHVHIYFNLAVGPFLEFRPVVTVVPSDPDLHWLLELVEGLIGAIVAPLPADPVLSSYISDVVARNFSGVEATAEASAEQADPADTSALVPGGANRHPRVDEYVSRVVGIRGSDLPATPRLILTSGRYNRDAGMALDIDIDRGGNPIRLPGDEVDVYAAGDGILEPLRLFMASEPGLEGLEVKVENRWVGEQWMSVTLRCRPGDRYTSTFFSTDPGTWRSAVDFLGLDRTTLELADRQGRLTAGWHGDELVLDDRAFDQETGTAFWAVRVTTDDERVYWMTGVTTSPRTPLVSRAKEREAVESAAETQVVDDAAIRLIGGVWNSIRNASLDFLPHVASIAPAREQALRDVLRPLGRFWLEDQFDLTSLTPDGRDVDQVVGQFTLVDVVGPTLGTVGTVDDQRRLGQARTLLSEFLYEFGATEVRRLNSLFDEAEAAENEGGGVSYEAAVVFAEVRAAQDLAASLAALAFDRRVRDDYDDLPRPEYYVRTVRPPNSGRSVWLSHVSSSFVPDRERDLHYDDTISIRTYGIRTDWSIEFRVASRGFPPTTVFDVSLSCAGVSGGRHSVHSVDLDVVGVQPGNGPVAVTEVMSDPVAATLELPSAEEDEDLEDEIPEADLVSGFITVRVQIRAPGAGIVVDERIRLDAVISSSFDWTDTGRALRERVAGEVDARNRAEFGQFSAPSFPSFGSFGPENSSSAPILVNPAVDDLLGHLRSRHGQRRPPRPPLPPNPAVDNLLDNVGAADTLLTRHAVRIPDGVLERWQAHRVSTPPRPRTKLDTGRF